MFNILPKEIISAILDEYIIEKPSEYFDSFFKTNLVCQEWYHLQTNKTKAIKECLSTLKQNATWSRRTMISSLKAFIISWNNWPLYEEWAQFSELENENELLAFDNFYRWPIWWRGKISPYDWWVEDTSDEYYDMIDHIYSQTLWSN